MTWSVVRQKAAYDDEPVTPEEITAMEEGQISRPVASAHSSDVMKDLGDDNVIDSRTS